MMEGIQHIQHYTVDNIYQAELHWRIFEDTVEILVDGKWQKVDIPVRKVTLMPKAWTLKEEGDE